MYVHVGPLLLVKYCILYIRTGELNYIAMGVCDSAYATHLLPGWEEVSVAFHTDEGSIFHSSDDAIPLNKACKNGDVIKVSISNYPQDPTKVTVDFYCNGQSVYHTEAALPDGGFYGIVGLMSLGEKIKISEPVITKKVEFEEMWEVSTPHAITHEGWGVCSYSGAGDYKETSIGTIRGKSPVNPLGEITTRTLEVRIINPGEARYIAIGVVNESYPTNLFPGWREPSVGYHADNGNLFCGTEQSTNRPCKAGDLMKCILNSVDGSPKRVVITFYRNLIEVGQVTTWTPQGGFFLCVGMMSRSEKVDVVLPEIVIPYKPSTQANTICYEDYWEEITPHLVHEGEGVYQYVGQGGQDFVGSIRSKHPMDPFGPGNWFEVKIVNAGVSCYIAIGVCSTLYSPNKLLGWDDLSVGFHADNGLILQKNLDEQSTSHPCKSGDIIKCTIEPIDGAEKQVKVLFHRNGDLVGTATFWKPSSGYYAQVGCMSVGETVKVHSPGMDPSSPGHAPLPASQSTPNMASSFQGTGATPEMGHSPSEPRLRGDAPPGHPSHYHMDPNSPYDPHSYYYPFYPRHMHRAFPPPPQGGGFHPAHGSHGGMFMYMPHPSISGHPHHRIPRMPHPHHPFFEGSPHPNLRLPLHGDPNSSFPPAVRSPSQPRRQLSEQSTSRSTPTQPDPPQRLNTHPPDHPSSRGGVFSPAPGVDIGPPLEYVARSKQDPRGTEPVQVSQPLQTTAASSTAASSAQSQQAKGYPTKGLVDKPPTDRPPAEQPPKDQPPRSHKQPPTERSGIDHTDSYDQLPTPEVPPGPVEEIVEQPKLPTVQEATPPAAPIDEPVDRPSKPCKSSMRPPMISQLSVASSARIISREENKRFKVLHNVSFQESEGPFENSLPEDETLDNAFVVSRLPLTEKNPYFEVEIQRVGANGNIAVGLIWDNYPVFYLPGALEGSIAFHSLTGSVQTGGREVKSSQAAVSCHHGDVVGCRALLDYKSEVSDKKENSLQVEFYFNGCLLCTADVVLPPTGFFPAIGFKGYRSKVKFSQSIQLSPDTYFETHPLPKNYRNFPSPLPLPSGWQCLRNAEVKSNNMLHMTENKPGTPAVIQNRTPLTKTSPYFEVELQYVINNYSVLAIGATPRTVLDTKKIIPGEAPGSVGFLPLLGFIMKNSSISSTVPDVIQTTLSSQRASLGIGVDFHSPPGCLDTSCCKSDKLDVSMDTSSSNRVRVFFTVNRQQVSCIYMCLPDDGLYPSLAIDSDAIQTVNCMALVHFPVQWPPGNGLPIGFVRGPQPTVTLYDDATFVDNRPGVTDLANASVRAIQAATPLSPSNTYYEIRIIDGGDTFKISCGLAPFNYTLTLHPGWAKDSIALHADDGKLFQDGNSKLVCPPPRHRGTIMGCGLRFPEGAPKRYAEAFFTVNRKLVAKRLVKVPQLGFFPTIGVRTQRSIVTVDLFAPDPFPDMVFGTSWGEIRNVKVEGSVLQLVSQSEPGAIIQTTPLKSHDLCYFSVTPLSEREGRIIVGYSTSKLCPLNLLHSSMEGLKAYAVDITMGVVMVYDHYFQTKETFGVQKGKEFGCGLLPQSSINKLLLFFTVDGQAISFTAIDDIDEDVYPFVLLMDSPTRVQVNMCALWPPSTPVGWGWAKHPNVKLVDTTLTHSALPGKRKFPVGFLQASTPLTPFSPYFEIEICSRAADKAIAIGLASRRYPTNSWVGWSADSIAYHLDDGKLFKVSNFGHNFGPKAFAGDTVGCGVRFGTGGLASAVRGEEKVEVFFTINGGVIGTQKVTIPVGGMFPTVCLESPSESVIFTQHDQYPPIPSMVCDKEWSSAYCVVQSGLLIQNSHRNLIPSMTKAFCQAKNPFAPCKCYFEILITDCTEHSQVQVGLSTLIPPGTTTPNTYSIVYSAQGQIITRRASYKGGTQKYTSHAQKAGIGDRMGCFVVFSGSTPTAVEFYLNQMKVVTVNISDFWASQNVYPTVILTNPQDSVMPFLNIPRPRWDPHSLAGWLRSERVKQRNRIIEYTEQGKTFHDVGVAQVSHTLQVSKNSYFEVEVLDPGERCTISVGIAPANYPLNRHPGWEKESIACHGDDGDLFQACGSGYSFGPSWKKGDVIGLGVRSASTETTSPDSEVQVFFARNGEEIGHTSHLVPPGGLFPTIGLHSPGEKVKVQMGDSNRFPCNIEPRRAMWRALCGIHVTGDNEGGPHILTFRENGRKMLKLSTLISIAISAQPFSSSMQYFEVELLRAGSIGIAVGVAPRRYPLNQATGWVEGSVAYHTDDGCLYAGTIKGTVFGPVSHKGEC